MQGSLKKKKPPLSHLKTNNFLIFFNTHLSPIFPDCLINVLTVDWFISESKQDLCIAFCWHLFKSFILGWFSLSLIRLTVSFG